MMKFKNCESLAIKIKDVNKFCECDINDYFNVDMNYNIFKKFTRLRYLYLEFDVITLDLQNQIRNNIMRICSNIKVIRIYSEHDIILDNMISDMV